MSPTGNDASDPELPTRPTIKMNLTLPPLPTAFNRELCARVARTGARPVEKKLRFRLYALATGKTQKSKVSLA